MVVQLSSRSISRAAFALALAGFALLVAVAFMQCDASLRLLAALAAGVSSLLAVGVVAGSKDPDRVVRIATGVAVALGGTLIAVFLAAVVQFSRCF
jgi:hypothetical protein